MIKIGRVVHVQSNLNDFYGSIELDFTDLVNKYKPNKLLFYILSLKICLSNYNRRLSPHDSKICVVKF